LGDPNSTCTLAVAEVGESSHDRNARSRSAHRRGRAVDLYQPRDRRGGRPGPIARAGDVAAAVEQARAAAAWWAGLGFAGRRTRLLQFRGILANRMPEIADLLRRECGKPVVDGVVEAAAFLPHIPWAARNARRVLGLRRVRGSTLVLEFSARLEYQPLGVIGAIGPWNYPVAAICSLAPTRWPPVTRWSTSPASTPRA
jgi:acyl-CoA reductase-like NAD-dependent aldehyde dehydrogenase